MEAPKEPPAAIQGDADRAREIREAQEELRKVLQTKSGRARLRHATTQIATFTPPDGAQIRESP